MPEPIFVPKAGQVDYTNIRYAPVINVVITRAGKVLLLQRSSEMRHYPSYWSGISGFLDDAEGIEEKAFEELCEEAGIDKADVASFQRGQVLLQEAPEYRKTWFVVPVLATITTENFTLNWESQAAQWFDPANLPELDLLPGFHDVMNQFFPLTS